VTTLRIVETTAVYEGGVLRPEGELDIPEHERVTLRIELRQSGRKTGKYSMRDLVGLGKEIWEGVDAQEYVRKERASWDR
jgi:predicted DNA-binding antitoxin AbrB/MazE fold protein